MKKKNLISLAYALGIPLAVILAGLFLPNKPLDESLHYSIIDKTELLKNTSGPRIILIGGSNLSFGIDSERIKKQTGYNVVNAGIQGSYGMRFDINHAKKYIKKDDIIIVSPEYRNYYGSSFNGDKVLLYVLFDTFPEAKSTVPLSQWLFLSQFFPKYTIEKLNSFFKYYLMPIEKKNENGVYLRRSFNEYGDVNAHWDLEPTPFGTYKSPRGDFNPEALGLIQDLQAECVNKGADLFVTFPCLQKASYGIMETKIDLAYNRLKENNLKLLGNPKRYQVNDSLLFNTAYHLNKKGVDIRTDLLIEDLIKNGVNLQGNTSKQD